MHEGPIEQKTAREETYWDQLGEHKKDVADAIIALAQKGHAGPARLSLREIEQAVKRFNYIDTELPKINLSSLEPGEVIHDIATIILSEIKKREKTVSGRKKPAQKGTAQATSPTPAFKGPRNTPKEKLLFE